MMTNRKHYGRPGGHSRIILSLVISFLLSVPSSGICYQVNITSKGKEIHWETDTILYFIDPRNAPSGSVAEVKESLKTWSGAGGSLFSMVFAGETSGRTGGKNDGANVAVFESRGQNGILAVNYYWYFVDTGEIVDSDIIFNTDYPYVIQNVATHELGHSLSLGDLYGSADTEKTMYGYVAMNETKKINLHPDDIAGINRLYPNPNPPPPPDPSQPDPEPEERGGGGGGCFIEATNLSLFR